MKGLSPRVPIILFVTCLFLSWTNPTKGDTRVRKFCRPFWESHAKGHQLDVPPGFRVPNHSVDMFVYSTVTHNGQEVKIPRAIHAKIYPEHASCPKRSSFTDPWTDRQMEAMQALPGDQKGFLIAPELCSPTEWYNMAPQKPGLSLGYNFLDEIKAGKHVDLTVVPVYHGRSTRPASFKVCAVVVDLGEDGEHVDQGKMYEQQNN